MKMKTIRSIRQFIQNKTAQKQKEDGILKSAINYGLALLAKKFTDKAGNKLSSIFNK